MFVNVILYKHRGGLLWTGAMEQILGWARSRLKLSHEENKVDSSVTRYLEFVSKSTYLLDNLEGANVLLGQFLSYTNGGKNQIALMKLEHSSISNLYKQGLVASVIILFMICEGKKYYVSGSDIGDVGVG